MTMEGLPSGAGAGAGICSLDGTGDSEALGASLLGSGEGATASDPLFSGSTAVDVSFFVGSGAVAGPGAFFTGDGSIGWAATGGVEMGRSLPEAGSAVAPVLS